MSNCNCNKVKPEMPSKVPACIRNIQPSCDNLAVIPSINVETIDGLKGIQDCFVHVMNINTTYYVDDKHRITTIWAGPIFADEYDYQTNELNVRGNTVYDFVNNRAIVFNNSGDYRIISITA